MNKGKICIVAKQEASTLRSTLIIAELLSEHHYEVEYTGMLDETSLRYLKNQGYEYRSFINRPPPDFRQAKSLAAKRAVIRQIAAWEKEVLQRCNDHYRQQKPVLVLFEVLNTTWISPFITLGVPILAFSVTMQAPFSTTIPSVHSDIVPVGGLKPKNRIEILVNWLKLYKYDLTRRWKEKLLLRLLFGTAKLPFINYKRFFRKAGYKTIWGDYPDNNLRIDIPTLFFCPKEFDFPSATILPNRYYAGASVQVNRNEDEFNWDGVDLSKKIVYATLGSLSSFYGKRARKNFYSSILKAFLKRSDCNLILQVGQRSDLKGLSIPNNVFVHDWVPHTKIFERVSLVICHAGLATLREAIYFGIPTLVYPWGGDQPGNAARIVYHKLGLRGDFHQVSAERMLKQIEQIEESVTIRSAVLRFQEYFRQQEAFTFGIDFFEKFMHHPPLHTSGLFFKTVSHNPRS